MYPIGVVLFIIGAAVPPGFVDCAHTTLALDCAKMIELAARQSGAPRDMRMIIKLPENGSLQELEEFLAPAREGH